MHSTVNTKWHMTVWHPARSRWPTIVTGHPALESWSAREPLGCPICDSPPLIPPSFLAFIAQEGILDAQVPSKEATLSLIAILNIHRNQSYLWLPWGLLRKTFLSVTVLLHTLPVNMPPYNVCNHVHYLIFPLHFCSSVCLMSWPSTPPFGSLGSYSNRLAPLR